MGYRLSKVYLANDEVLAIDYELNDQFEEGFPISKFEARTYKKGKGSTEFCLTLIDIRDECIGF